MQSYEDEFKYKARNVTIHAEARGALEKSIKEKNLGKREQTKYRS